MFALSFPPEQKGGEIVNNSKDQGRVTLWEKDCIIGSV